MPLAVLRPVSEKHMFKSSQLIGRDHSSQVQTLQLWHVATSRGTQLETDHEVFKPMAKTTSQFFMVPWPHIWAGLHWLAGPVLEMLRALGWGRSMQADGESFKRTTSRVLDGEGGAKLLHARLEPRS